MIVLNNLCKSFGKIKAIDDISFDFSPSLRWTIHGDSGCGKTTLLSLISGILLPDSGDIQIDGVVTSTNKKLLPPHRRKIGFAFQNTSLWPHMRVKDNILFGLPAHKKSKSGSVLSDVVTALKLENLENSFPDELSGGQAKRVSLARAIASMPSILLLDEPLTNIESELKTRIIDFILNSKYTSSSTVIYVTHDISEAELFGGKVINMANGKVEKI